MLYGSFLERSRCIGCTRSHCSSSNPPRPDNISGPSPAVAPGAGAVNTSVVPTMNAEAPREKRIPEIVISELPGVSVFSSTMIPLASMANVSLPTVKYETVARIPDVVGETRW